MEYPATTQTPGFEFTKILLLGIASACVFGVVHDMVTAHLYPPYFWVHHQDPFDHETTPTFIYALYFGVAATWYVGATLGILLAIAARAGRHFQLSWRSLVRPIALLVLAIGLASLVQGLRGYRWANDPTNAGTLIEEPIFYAVWWAHQASYLFGGMFGLILVVGVLIWRRRRFKDLRRDDLSEFPSADSR